MIDIEQGRRMLRDGTPGPWVATRSGQLVAAGPKVVRRRAQRSAAWAVVADCPSPCWSDAELIAWAVNALPELLDEVADLRARLDESVAGERAAS